MSSYDDSPMASTSRQPPVRGSPGDGRRDSDNDGQKYYYDDHDDQGGQYYDGGGDDGYSDDQRRPTSEDRRNGRYGNDDQYDDDYDDQYDDDDGHYGEGDFFEDDFDEDERERKARDRANKNKRKPTKVYEVEDSIVRDDANDDEEDPESMNNRRRDYWGRERKNCCDCFRICCLSCLHGFRSPPACEPRRLCECPHGWCYTTMGVVLGISGLIMCSFYIISCDVERITILYNGAKPPDAPRIGYGFLSRGVTFEEVPTYMSCITYTDEEKAALFDIWMHSARFFLFFSTFLAVIGAIVLFTAICVAWSPNTFEHWLMWTYIIAGLTVPLSYLLFGSPLCADNECKFGQGGVQCISIFLFWLCCANTVKSYPTALPPRRDDDDNNGYNGEEDDDDLYYETEEDMWNDRRPPKPANEGDVDPYNRQNPYTMDPEYVDDDANYDDHSQNHRAHPSYGGKQPPYYDDQRNSSTYDNVFDDDHHHPNNNDGAFTNDPPHASSSSRPRVGDDDGPTIT